MPVRFFHLALLAILIGLPSPNSGWAQTDVISTAETSDIISDIFTSPEASPSEPAAQVVTIETEDGCQQFCVLPQDEIWVVSARDYCQNFSLEPRFPTQRLVSGNWLDTQTEELIAEHHADLNRQTLVFVHGNNTNYNYAVARGMQFYKNVFGCSGDCRPPLRLVIFAWRSDRVYKRPLKDYRTKSKNSVKVGTALAGFLKRFGNQSPLVTGYSLGCQVVMSALGHLPTTDTGLNCCETGFRIALIAPAFDPDYACHNLGDAVNCSPIGQAEVFVNRHDRVVCASRLVSRKNCEIPTVEPSLLGMWENGQLDRQKFHLDDVTRETPNKHALLNYAKAPTLKREMLKLVRSAAATVPNIVENLELPDQIGR